MGPLRGVARAAALFFAVVRGYDLEPDTVAHNLGCVQWAPPSGQGKGSPVEVGKGAQLCRTLGGAAAARSPQETVEWRLGTVAADGTCRGSEEFELGSSPPEARLFWHKQVRASSAAILQDIQADRAWLRGTELQRAAFATHDVARRRALRQGAGGRVPRKGERRLVGGSAVRRRSRLRQVQLT